MPNTALQLNYIIQDSQEFGSTDEHMISRVFFDLTIDGKPHQDLYCIVKQSVGSWYVDAPLEVSKPVGYKGPFNHQAFSHAVEQYYRKSFRGIAMLGAGAIVRMQHNRFDRPETVVFDSKADGTSW
jgi:hypothetical protein